MVLFGDRMPGATGEQVARSILGRTPDDITYQPTRRRWPVVAWRFPLTFLVTPRRLLRFQADTDAWYERRLTELDGADSATARPILSDAADRLARALTIQGIPAFGLVQPLYGLVEKVVGKAGYGDPGILSGSGGIEVSGMVSDLWQVSRERLDLAEVIRRHGFHGPAEGELSSRVWRDDPAPLHRRVAEYRALPDDHDPQRREQLRHAERLIMVRRIAST